MYAIDMEFTCRISSAEYVEALRLKRKNLNRIVIGVLGLDAMLWIYWMVLAAEGQIAKASAVMTQAIPFLLWPLFYLIFLGLYARYSYSKNRNIKSEFVYRVSGDGFSYESSSGGSGSTPWGSFSYWHESRRVIILVFPSNIFLICPKTCLAADRLEEFKTILGAALTKK